MKKAVHRYSLIILLGMSWVAGFGQGPGGFENDTYPNISGTIVQENEEPLEYATVSLLSGVDSSLVDGAITDSQGRFALKVNPGNYIVRIQFVTFETKDIPVEVKAGQATRLKKIIIQESTTQLNEVVVQAERTQMELTLDKKIYNVGKDLSNLGGSASDILENLPSISVDVEGNVSLRGSNAVRILVDGKPSGLVGMSSADALRQLQASIVERVEVITNPSARYDAEGSAGIINIILKKEKAKGINGSFQVNTGWPHNHGLSFNLNFRKKWVNLFTNVGIGYRKAPGGGESKQEFNYPDTSYRTNLDRDMLRGGISYNARFGADFFVGEGNTLTAYGLYRFSDEDNLTTVNYFDYDVNDNLSRTRREDDQLEDDYNVEYGLSFKREFGRKGHVLNADLQYQNNSEVERSDLVEATGPSGNQLEPLLFQRSENDEGEEQYMFQVDYVHPFGEEGSFELGTRMTWRDIHNDFTVENLEDGIWEIDSGLTNDFDYLEDIYAFYGIFSNRYRKLSYQFGARVEVTDIKTRLVQTGEENTQNYANFFPSAFFTYDLTDIHKIQVSYSRRVRRPRFRDLNPFFSISDNRNFFVGNPNLRPQFTDSYEVGYLQNFKKSSIYYGVYYRHTEDLRQRITTVVDGIRIRRPENLGYGNSFGFETNISREFNSWYRLSGNANLYWAMTEGIVYQGTDLEQDLSAETVTFQTRVNNNFKVGNFMDAQLNVTYRAPQNTTQGRRLAMASVDLGATKDILNKNGTLSVSVRDLFNTRKYRGITDLDNYYEESWFQWRARQLTVSFIYRLNQKKQRRRGGGQRGGGSGFDDDGGF